MALEDRGIIIIGDLDGTKVISRLSRLGMLVDAILAFTAAPLESEAPALPIVITRPDPLVRIRPEIHLGERAPVEYAKHNTDHRFAYTAQDRRQQANLNGLYRETAKGYSSGAHHAQHRSRENRVAEARRNAASYKP